ncbi:hypothetical protein [Chitinivorax sp. B]|uniref:hypothetical protein n=1 Tax=Chitinivorax sp. B TaxID=2502235 RepID=UPI0010F6DA76|nr:hypothetical protein [Chitinivorax sp. B]
MKRNHLLFAAYLLMPLYNQAVNATPLPAGEYATERGWGTLSIKSVQNGKQAFSIDVAGTNGHSCGLDGQIINGIAKLTQDYSPGEICVVSFDGKAGQIDVGIKAGDEYCRYYCGARAYFEGSYFKQPSTCQQSNQRRTKDAFLAQYRKKDYQQAYDTLSPLLAQCSKFMHWYDEGRVINDIAITQYKLKDYAGCVKTLQPLAEDAALTDEQIREKLPPVDAETWLPVVKATRTNLSLCKAAAK